MALQGINTVVLNWVKSNHWCLMGLSYFSLGWNTETKKQWAPQLFGPQSKLACCWRNGWWDNNTGQEKRDEKGDVHILCLIHREGRDSSISLYPPVIGESYALVPRDALDTPQEACHWTPHVGSMVCVMKGDEWLCWWVPRPVSPLNVSLFFREMQTVGDTCRRNQMNGCQLYWHHILKTRMDTWWSSQVLSMDTPFGLQLQLSNRTSDHIWWLEWLKLESLHSFFLTVAGFERPGYFTQQHQKPCCC